MYLNKYDFSQFHEISIKKLLAEGIDKKAADEIAKKRRMTPNLPSGWCRSRNCSCCRC
jgi:hypothetical protein